MGNIINNQRGNGHLTSMSKNVSINNYENNRNKKLREENLDFINVKRHYNYNSCANMCHVCKGCHYVECRKCTYHDN